MNVKKTVTIGMIGLLILASSSAVAEDIFAASTADEVGSDAEVPGDTTAARSEGGGLSFGGPLLLTKYTMQAGGAITLEPRFYIPKNGGDSQNGGYFNFSPSLGFFIIDNLELLFSFGLGIPFGDFSGWDVTVGFALGARYLIDFDAVVFYAGGMLGSSFGIPDNVNLPVRKHFDITVLVGILFPLNRHVGVDLGMRFETSVLLGDYPGENLHSTIAMPIGYLGIDAFFNLFTGG